MTTYRTSPHWPVAIIRDDGPGAAELVAVVVNGDQALAERICALLNGAEIRPCDVEREPYGEWCTGTLVFSPDDIQAKCSTCGGWTGRLAPRRMRPSSPLSAPRSAEQPPVGGPGGAEGSETLTGAVHADCDCGHEGLPEQWHLRPCTVAERRIAHRRARLTGTQERADVRRRIAEQAEHRPSSLGDGLGYGPCVGCGQLWPCTVSRGEVS